MEANENRAPLPLFRPEAVAAQRHDASGGIVLTRAWWFVVLDVFLAAVAAALILFACFGSYTAHTTLRGRLVVEQGVVEVASGAAGTIVERRAAEGQRATAGETLYVVSSERFPQAGTATTGQEIAAQLARRRASLVAQISSTAELERTERDALAMRRAALGAELGSLDEALVAERRRLELMTAAVERYERMHALGFVADEQAAQREAALLEQQSRIDSMRRERAGLERLGAELEGRAATLPLEHAHAVAELERAVAGTDLEIAENDASRASIVTAPATGTVTAPTGEVAEPVERGQVLARIVPDGALLEAELFAPSRAVGFVAAGGEVRLRYAAFPYQKFGLATGTVVSVSEAPLAPADAAARAGVRGEAVYRIVVVLRSQTVVAYGVPRPLKPGMDVEADVLLETRRLYEWALEPLFALAGRIRH